MNAIASKTWGELDLIEMDVQPMHEKELMGISGGVDPVSVGFGLAVGLVGVVVVGAIVGIAVYCLTH